MARKYTLPGQKQKKDIDYAFLVSLIARHQDSNYYEVADRFAKHHKLSANELLRLKRLLKEREGQRQHAAMAHYLDSRTR